MSLVLLLNMFWLFGLEPCIWDKFPESWVSGPTFRVQGPGSLVPLTVRVSGCYFYGLGYWFSGPRCNGDLSSRVAGPTRKQVLNFGYRFSAKTHDIGSHFSNMSTKSMSLGTSVSRVST